ncbi:MAG: PHP domain-containing protein [Cetobacterium sp.]
MEEKKIYTNYHLHSEDSNPVTMADSAETPDNYLKRIKELGHNVYCSTEHGVSSNWVRKYLKVKEFNKKHELTGDKEIKFIYAVEAYIDYNESFYHMIMIAKNANGAKAINRAIYDARDNIKRRRPGITVDNLKANMNEDVIATTACIGGLFKEPTGNLLIEIAKIFKRNLWVEIAPHSSDMQREFNYRALGLAKKYDLILVSANDSHFAYPEGKHDRDELLLSKGLVYDNEGDFYMDYPDYEEVLRRYDEQGVVSRELAMLALDNTNKIRNFETLELGEGGDFKVPTLYPNLTRAERCRKLINIVNKNWEEYAKKYVSKEDYPKYSVAIKNELTEVFNCGMEDFFLTSMEILNLGVSKGGIITKSNRGSSSSYFINNLLGFTSIDRIKSKVPILMERFITSERILSAKTTPDIDCNIADPTPFIEAQSELLGEKSSLPMIAFGTLKAKSAFKMLCRAKGNVSVELQNLMSKKITEFETEMKYASDEDKEFIKLEDFMDNSELYDLYKDGENYFGMITDPKQHACGYLVSNENLVDMIGVNYSATGDMCVNLEGKYAEKLGYLKLDWLTVSVVELIDKVYKEIGIEQPNASDLYDKVTGDVKTWDIYERGITMCVNQVEKPKTTSKCMKYKPKTVEELCALIAAVRPGFKTFYKRFESREEFLFGVKPIDDLIKGDYSDSSWLLYQEHVMLILEWAGFEPKKTYETLKGIGKKNIELIMMAKDQFLKQCKEHIIAEGFTEFEAVEKAQNIWQVIENSAEYSL